MPCNSVTRRAALCRGLTDRGRPGAPGACAVGQKRQRRRIWFPGQPALVAVLVGLACRSDAARGLSSAEQCKFNLGASVSPPSMPASCRRARWPSAADRGTLQVLKNAIDARVRSFSWRTAPGHTGGRERGRRRPVEAGEKRGRISVPLDRMLSVCGTRAKREWGGDTVARLGSPARVRRRQVVPRGRAENRLYDGECLPVVKRMKSSQEFRPGLGLLELTADSRLVIVRRFRE